MAEKIVTFKVSFLWGLYWGLGFFTAGTIWLAGLAAVAWVIVHEQLRTGAWRF
jgi:hypothetical protein